jgi:hypothetical protein
MVMMMMLRPVLFGTKPRAGLSSGFHRRELSTGCSKTGGREVEALWQISVRGRTDIPRRLWKKYRQEHPSLVAGVETHAGAIP